LLLCGLCPSKSEARRLITQGGLTVDEEKITAIDRAFSAEQLKDGLKIRKGKKVYHKALLK
ncbi:MAG: tyrosine--tRNA ligase, partial [Firmicutes bacterium]|nr:tyrosine--tRNA ligase [Bacillota bacterium]